MSNAAVISTMAERLEEFGGISPDRVRMIPAPGTATLDDLREANVRHDALCELIDQTLVEKAMSYDASVVAGAILGILRAFIIPRKLGLISGADGFFQLPASNVRGPDVAFVSRERLPDGRIPREAYPPIAPNLAVEVLRPGNTKQEMSRKRNEYFHSGVKPVWIVDCVDRSVAVYTSPSAVTVLNEEATITADGVVSGFSCAVAAFFADLDLGVE